MKRVLIITYYWPPSGGAGVQRWLKFSKFLPEFGWQPVIYTPENPEAPIEDPSLIHDIKPDVEVIKKPIWEPYMFYKKFLGLKPQQKINAGFLAETEKPGLKEKISIWIRGNLFIPDARKFWIKPSVRFLSKYLQTYPVDVIVSTGPPHSMHLIAAKTSKATNIPWLADFRDPWTGIDYYQDLMLTSRSDKKHRGLEKKVLQQADVVTTIGNMSANEFHRIAGINPEVIHNGYDEDDFREARGKDPEIFTIIHVGAMNKDRNHEIFWSALDEIINREKKQIAIRLVGKLDVSVIKSIEQYQLHDHVDIIPSLPHDKIANELKSATLLYLPVNNTPNARLILTGKIFEYLAAGRPILGIGPEDGEIAEIINNAGAGNVIDFKKKDQVKKTLAEHLIKWETGKIKNPDISKTEQFSRRNLTGQLASILDNMQTSAKK